MTNDQSFTDYEIAAMWEQWGNATQRPGGFQQETAGNVTEFVDWLQSADGKAAYSSRAFFSADLVALIRERLG